MREYTSPNNGGGTYCLVMLMAMVISRTEELIGAKSTAFARRLAEILWLQSTVKLSCIDSRGGHESGNLNTDMVCLTLSRIECSGKNSSAMAQPPGQGSQQNLAGGQWAARLRVTSHKNFPIFSGAAKQEACQATDAHRYFTLTYWNVRGIFWNVFGSLSSCYPNLFWITGNAKLCGQNNPHRWQDLELQLLLVDKVLVWRRLFGVYRKPSLSCPQRPSYTLNYVS